MIKGWTKKTALERMQVNQDLPRIYGQYPLAKLLIESAAELKRYPGYHRISCYYAYKDWLHAAVSIQETQSYWICAKVIDDLLPPDANDLHLKESSAIATANPILPNLPSRPSLSYSYITLSKRGKPMLKAQTMTELRDGESELNQAYKQRYHEMKALLEGK